MAVQSKWRMDALEKQQAAIRIAHDPILNDKSTSKQLRDYQRDRLTNSPMIAAAAEREWSQADQVLRAALAGSDPEDAKFFPQQRTPKS